MAADNTTAIANSLDADPFGVTPDAPLPTYDEAQTLVQSADEWSAALGAIMTKLETSASERAEKMTGDARRQFAGLQRNENGVGKVGPEDGAIASVMKAAELKALQQAREIALGALKLEEPVIDEIKKRLHKAEQRLAAFTRTFPNAVSLLAVQRLEDPKRATYHNNVARAGRNELHTLARVAIQTGDRALGAAIVARVHELPPDQRPFSPHALADRLVGGEYQAMKLAHGRLAAAYQSAYNRVVAYQTGRSTSSVTKLAAGLRDRANAPKQPATRTTKQQPLHWSEEQRKQAAIDALPN